MYIICFVAMLNIDRRETIRKDIYKATQSFRLAILEAKYSGAFDCGNRFSNFLGGCFDDACDLWVYYLKETFGISTKQGNMSATDIEECVAEYVSAKLYENDFDAEIIGVVISGSRCRGLEGKNSDLDVVVQLSGNEREDDLFNLLHEDKFRIGGVLVDINPITEYKTGTLEEYLPGVEKYLEEKVRQIGKKPSVTAGLQSKKMQVAGEKKKETK